MPDKLIRILVQNTLNKWKSKYDIIKTKKRQNQSRFWRYEYSYFY